MEYEYKGNKYTLKKDVLGLYRDALPLISERSRLIFEINKSIDRGLILKYEKDLKSLQLERLKLEKREKDTAEISKQIEDLNDKYETDSNVRAIVDYYNESVSNAMIQIVLNEKLMSKVIPKILEGDCSIFDYSDIDCIQTIIVKTVADFFFVMTKSKTT